MGIKSESAPIGIMPTVEHQALRVAVVLAMHVAADLISAFWGAAGNTTVRGDSSAQSR